VNLFVFPIIPIANLFVIVSSKVRFSVVSMSTSMPYLTFKNYPTMSKPSDVAKTRTRVLLKDMAIRSDLKKRPVFLNVSE
jgi:hypothetical protein